MKIYKIVTSKGNTFIVIAKSKRKALCAAPMTVREFNEDPTITEHKGNCICISIGNNIY
jgi:hypothetical protein